MHATRLLSQNLRLTLFTRANCGLCDSAKQTMTQVQRRKPGHFHYSEVDIMKPENKAWRDLYDFDVPVLHLQKILNRPEGRGEGGRPEVLAGEANKLFHRFSEEQVEDAMREAERSEA